MLFSCTSVIKLCLVIGTPCGSKQRDLAGLRRHRSAEHVDDGRVFTVERLLTRISEDMNRKYQTTSAWTWTTYHLKCAAPDPAVVNSGRDDPWPIDSDDSTM